MKNLIGKTILIVSMLGEPHYANKMGVVKFVDDAGQLHGTWGGLAVQPEHDKYIVIGE